MAFTVHENTRVEAEEYGGVLVAGARESIIESDIAADWTGTASDVRAILNDSGLPDAGETWDADNPALIVRRRVVSMMTPRRWTVRAHYDYANLSLNLESPKAPLLSTLTSGLKTITADRKPGFGPPMTTTAFGQTKVSPITALDQDLILNIPVQVITHLPGMISSVWTNAINSVPWKGAPAATWVCQGVTFDPINLTPGRDGDQQLVFMNFSFRHDRNRYEYESTWRDETQGETAADLTISTGRILINDWHTRIDFNQDPPRPVHNYA